MKIKLNTTTNYEGCTFKIGDEIDLPLNVAQRWINKGIAHIPAEIPFNDFVPSKKEQKIIDEYSEKQGWPIKEEKTEESIIFREPEVKEKVTEVDVVEPIPMDHYVDFDEPKEVKPIKKAKKNK